MPIKCEYVTVRKSYLFFSCAATEDTKLLFLLPSAIGLMNFYVVCCTPIILPENVLSMNSPKPLPEKNPPWIEVTVSSIYFRDCNSNSPLRLTE